MLYLKLPIQGLFLNIVNKKVKKQLKGVAKGLIISGESITQYTVIVLGGELIKN